MSFHKLVSRALLKALAIGTLIACLTINSSKQKTQKHSETSAIQIVLLIFNISKNQVQFLIFRAKMTQTITYLIVSDYLCAL